MMQTILNFLNDLKANNNRVWFTENKQRYVEAKNYFDDFVNFLIPAIKKFDSSVDVNAAKDCTFRIYKDVRFSKDKAPYKTNMGAYIAKGGKKSPFAGYYIHIDSDTSFAGGGIYCPQPAVLKAVRTEISEDATALNKILKNKSFHSVFPELYGDKVKTAPRGFDKNHPNIELLRFKSYTVIKQLSNKDIVSNTFSNTVLHIFKTQKPFNDYLNACISE